MTADTARAEARRVELPARVSTALTALGPLAAGYVLPFVLVVYLGLKGGGYDAVVRGEVGIAVWWVVLLGVIAGVLPRARLSRAGWLAIGVFGAFALWSALGISWSESSERSVAELGRVVTLLGVFVLALLVQGREGLRRTVSAVAAGCALLGVLALLSRLQPDWFPASVTADLLPSFANRLSYPLNYWNGLAALMAFTVPLMLALATTARMIAARALAAATVPALALTAFFTLSRGGAVELACGLVVLLALHPRRLGLVSTLAPAALGAAVLILAATQRDALIDAPLGAAAAAEAGEMLAMTIVVCAGVGLVQAAISLAERHGLGPRIRPSRRTTVIGAGVALVLALAIPIAAGLPAEVSDGWQEFKQPIGPESGAAAERFESASGSGRYQYWDAALEANATEPLTGIGPGTYEFWWAREGSIPGFIRDAHSLYLETLSELGIVGLALVLGLVGTVLGTGIARVVPSGSPERRALLAGALGAATAFAVASAIDWTWS